MSREILFRGKRTDNGGWVEGDIIFDEKPNTRIRRRDGFYFPADPSTVCQYTGLKDASGNKIWENDIIETEPHEHDIGVVRYGTYNAVCGYGDIHVGFYVEWQAQSGYFRNDLGFWANCRNVIGNVFDNTELLDGGASEE